MNMRMDKDGIVYIDYAALNDKWIVYPVLGHKWVCELYKAGGPKYFDSQVLACKYALDMM